MVLEVDEIPHIPRHRKPKNKPTDSAWKQQRLSARRPILTIPAVFKVTIVVGLIILGLGFSLYFVVERSLKLSIDYTDCVTIDNVPAKKLALLNQKPKCIINFELTVNYSGKVKFYYQLDGFYQNFRTYTTSRNDKQLDGNLYKTDGCKPYACVPTNKSKSWKDLDCTQKDYDSNNAIPIVPCGTIANSMFNDSFVLYYNEPGSDPIKVPFSTKDVLSEIERNKKFRNPQDNVNATDCQSVGCGCDQYKNTAKPPNWEKPLCELGVYNASDDDEDVGWGMKNIDFQVWMKTSALPNFRKPYRTLNSQYEPFNYGKDGGLPAGNYTLIVSYNYNVDSYKINKSFVITRENWIGPRNFFLPVIYMATGVFIILAMGILCAIHECKTKFTRETT